MVDIDQVLTLLRERGYKATEPRVALLNEIMSYQKPFTADEIYAKIKGKKIGRATVFRTLRLFLDLDILVRVHLEEDCQHYQFTADTGCNGAHHHDRIICRQCGGISYLDECPMKDNVFEIAKRCGYRVEGHHLDLYGICPQCDGKNG